MADAIRSSEPSWPLFGRPTIVEVAGDIDLANAETLAEVLCQAIDRTSNGLIVDLTTVPSMDCCAMSLLIRVHQHASENGHTVTWKGMQPTLARVVELTCLAAFLHIEQCQRALSAAHSRPEKPSAAS